MTVHLHRATRTDQLADGLGELLAIPGDDPFADEVVVVPTRGVERWLAQRMSHRLGATASEAGVCAGIRFVNAPALISVLLGRDRSDPWAPDHLAWDVLAVIDESMTEPWAGVLARHLDGDQSHRDRRWTVAAKLARLFATYAGSRPQMLADWSAGGIGDGVGADLPTDLHWQPELWRRVSDRVTRTHQVATPQDRLAAVVADLQAGGSADLPPRLSLFGHTRLAAADVTLLTALGVHHEVHLWLPQPSPDLWDRLAGAPVRRRSDESARGVNHRLLASLGRDARELRRTLDPLLAGGGPASNAPASDKSASDEQVPRSPVPSTLLGWLQHDIAGDTEPDAALRDSRRVDAGDRSIQVHACHGTSRQVEVLREVVTGLLADDPSLEPRDIVVMCPDIETFAPLINAAFGLGEAAAAGHPAHHIRVRLADRGAGATNPCVTLAFGLIGLASGRGTVADVIDLLSTEVVARRFAFTDADLDRIAGWVTDAGVRWGLDTDHRGQFSMSRFAANTWEFGIDRLMVGAATDTDLGEVAAFGNVPSEDIELAGVLAEAFDRINTCVRALDSARTPQQWAAALSAGILGLSVLDADAEWQRTTVLGELARVAEEADPGTTLSLADVEGLLQARFGPRPTRANFRTGALTVCTLTPMRSVPHRVVCLIGMDDHAFPRGGVPDGDDVLAADPLTGEADRRSEDRQLLLDAVMAATDTLVITFTGSSELNGSERHPAVPVGELIDAVHRTATGTGSLVTHHRLQPFNAEALRADAPFSFDPAAYAGAVAAQHPDRRIRGPFSDVELPEVAGPLADVALDDLRGFFADPVAGFVRRLGVGLIPRPEESEEQIPVEVARLNRWTIGDRLLAAALRGDDDLALARDHEMLTGLVPPTAFGRAALDEITDEVRDLAQRAGRVLNGAPSQSHDVIVDLGRGRLLSGQVRGVHDLVRIEVSYSRLSAKQRVRCWIDALALSAAMPESAWRAHLIARGGDATVIPDPARARHLLVELVALRDIGLRRPLPLPPKTSLAWAATVKSKRGQPAAVAGRLWRTDRFGNAFGENSDPASIAVYGEDAPLSVLLGAGMPDLAEKVWLPMLAAETVVTQ